MLKSWEINLAYTKSDKVTQYNLNNEQGCYLKVIIVFFSNSNLIFSLNFYYVCKVGFSYSKSPSNKNTVV